jgi:hypothetical protein
MNIFFALSTILSLSLMSVTLLFAKEENPIEKYKLLNSPHFFGEPIVLSPHSSFIKNIQLDISLPPQHKFLPEASSKILILNGEGKLKKSFAVNDLKQALKLNQRFKFDKILITVQLNYCKDDAAPMCLFKNIIYEIPLDKSKKAEDLKLSFEVQEN